MENPSEELRPITAPELAQLSDLLDRVFPPVGGMFPAFPTFLSPENSPNLYGCFRDGELLAHVGTNRRYIQSCDVSLKTACIGAVAVAQEARGSGIASRLLEYTYARLQADGVHIALISGDRGLYTRSGAVFYGRVASHTVRTKATQSQHTPRPWSPKIDLATCMDIHESESVRFSREAHDWDLLAKEGRTVDGPASVLMLGDDAAYAVVREVGRGKWQVVEYAGERAAIVEGLNVWSAQHRKARITIEVPTYDHDMMSLLGGDRSHSKPYPGTLRVIDREALLSSLPDDLASKCPGDDLVSLAAHLFAGESAPRTPLPLYGLDFV